MTAPQPNEDQLRNDLDAWEDDLVRRYPEPAASRHTDPDKKEEEFRDYDAGADRRKGG